MIGRTISHYEILEKLGEGGMGVVYKARDTHLDRFGAVKVLPSEKVADPERKLRFVQEAKAASALNHASIITIYDIDQHNGVDFISMEYVEGRALDQLIGRKGLKLSEALKYAVQIADALAAAHEAGIVHRDLKPGNVMVTDKGQVKVLDFGLAKLTEAVPPAEEDATRTLRPVTEEGKIVGTVAYMSPEQAEGKKVDARSDIFSFGAVLYEMVTGKRAFHGDTRASTLAAILKESPQPAGQLIDGLPREIERLISRCLQKDVQRRFQHMDDVKIALEELKEESESGVLDAARARKPKRRWVWAAAAVLGIAFVAAGTWFAISTRRQAAVQLKPIPITGYPGWENWPSLSPDGNQVAFFWEGERGDNTDVYVKPVTGEAPPLRLTRDPAFDFSPAWSPDGTSIAFLRDHPYRSELLLISPFGGPERKLADLHPCTVWYYSGCLAWSPDGKYLVFPDTETPGGPLSLFALSLATRVKQRLTQSPIGLVGDSDPAVSPDGRTLAFIRSADLFTSGLYLLPLAEGLRPVGEPRRLPSRHQVVNHPAWTANGGEVVFSAGVMGRLGLWRVEASGSGETKPLGSPSIFAFTPVISRDGRRLVYVAASYSSNLWRMEIPRRENAPPHQVTSSTQYDHSPQYSPDGHRIAFASARSGSTEIWLCDADGSNAVQLTSLEALSEFPRWFPDGRRIVFESNKEGNYDVYVVGTEGGTPKRLTTHPAVDHEPTVSGDGRRIYFVSNRTGRWEVWRMAPDGGEQVQVTKQGGWSPRESEDGRRVYYHKSFSSFSPADLWAAPAEGGEETKVLDSVRGASFEVRRDGIYFIADRGVNVGPFLQFFSFASKTTTEIARFERGLDSGLSVSPDGRSALYPQQENTNADLMLVDNFR